MLKVGFLLAYSLKSLERDVNLNFVSGGVCLL